MNIPEGAKSDGAIRDYQPSPLFVEKISIGFARKFGLLGVKERPDEMSLLCGDQENWQQMDVVGRYLGVRVVPIIVGNERIQEAINMAYQSRAAKTEQFIDNLGSED